MADAGRAVKASMRTLSSLHAAGGSDPGLHRAVNEDRFHCDASRGLFLVVDGVGGQAAGGKAADIALTRLRERLERETGSIVDRVREAITIANNDIHRVAGLRQEWHGMACVLTVVVVEDHVAVIGHVGDTRLYKLRGNRIEKITRDHSPVGEREDARELSEFDAMHHPRRNEVYRDVGSEPHQPTDADFIDIHEMPFEPDAALLVCSDGLTDLLDSSSINQVVRRLAGRPRDVVRTLIEAANAEGGKDNVTVVYIEGERFSAAPGDAAWPSTDSTRPSGAARFAQVGPAVEGARGGRTAPPPPSKKQRAARLGLVSLLALAAAFAMVRLGPVWQIEDPGRSPAPARASGTIVVREGESIGAAMERAQPGGEVLVEPGEYRETLALKSDVRLRSRVPRAAIIRLPSTASEADAAVVASTVTGAEFIGFRVIGDAATPLGTGLLARDAGLSVVDVEVAGARNVAFDLSPTGRIEVIGCDIRDNPGTALTLRSGVVARIVHNVFARNGTSERVPALVMVEGTAQPEFSGNVFHGISSQMFGQLTEAARAALTRDNWFVPSQDSRPGAVGVPRGGRDR